LLDICRARYIWTSCFVDLSKQAVTTSYLSSRFRALNCRFRSRPCLCKSSCLFRLSYHSSCHPWPLRRTVRQIGSLRTSPGSSCSMHQKRHSAGSLCRSAGRRRPRSPGHHTVKCYFAASRRAVTVSTFVSSRWVNLAKWANRWFVPLVLLRAGPYVTPLKPARSYQ